MKSLKEKARIEIDTRPKAIFRLRNKDFDCPIELALDVIGGKWKILIIWNLFKCKRRYSEFKYLIPGINCKMLSQQLSELVRDEVLSKKIINNKPPLIVEYCLTKKGNKLKNPIIKLREWGLQYIVK
jgi:DNA-binding HxlR family transcriptional regulator